MVNLELDKKQKEFLSNVPLIMLLLLFLLFLLVLSRSTTSGACSVGPGVAWEPVNSQIVEHHLLDRVTCLKIVDNNGMSILNRLRSNKGTCLKTVGLHILSYPTQLCSTTCALSCPLCKRNPCHWPGLTRPLTSRDYLLHAPWRFPY